MSENKNESYFRKLIKGRINLVTTFWVWFVFLTIAINIFVDNNFKQIDYHRTTNDQAISIIIYLLIFIYSIFIFIAIQRSANNYQGNKIWVFSSKVIITINLFFSLFSAYDLLKISMFDDYAIKSEINSFKNNLPLKVNAFSELTDIGIKDKNIYYTYKLDSMDKDNSDTYNLSKFKEQVQNSLCEEENTLKLLKKDYILNYTYIDKNEKELIGVITNKLSCGKSIYDLDILKEILKNQS
jgi:hypothetical protein